MKPTKDSLRSEIEYRLKLLEDAMKEKDNKLLNTILANEHSMLSEIKELIDVFGRRIGYVQFEVLSYTPLKCARTGEPLVIGDKVENTTGQCGTLHFDDYTKRYVIKSKESGHSHSVTFIKIPELYEYEIDTNRVECRNSNKYLKKRW